MDGVAADASVPIDRASLVVQGALRRLHRLAVTDERGLTAVALEVYFALGPEACWNLFGLLEIQRLNHAPDSAWSETLLRLDGRMTVYRVLIEKWKADSDAGGAGS